MIKEKKLQFFIGAVWILVITNLLLLIGLHVHKKIKSGKGHVTHNKLHLNKKIEKNGLKVTSGNSPSTEEQKISTKSNSGSKKSANNRKKLNIWDKLIKSFFIIIAIYVIGGTIGPCKYLDDNILLSLLTIFVFGWDLFYIENNDASEDQKKLNHFFEIMIISLILSTLLIFFFVPSSLIGSKISAAIELFKLMIGSVLLSFVIKCIHDSNNFTWKTSLLYIFALTVLFVSYSSFAAIEDKDNEDNAPSAQEFQKMITHSSKSEIENYNKIINKTLKQRKISKH